MSTKDRLAQVLTEAGLVKMAERASWGRYDDFESVSATPSIDLVRALSLAGRTDLADRARQGEWDATPEEAEEWARSPEGQRTLADLRGDPQ